MERWWAFGSSISQGLAQKIAGMFSISKSKFERIQHFPSSRSTESTESTIWSTWNYFYNRPIPMLQYLEARMPCQQRLFFDPLEVWSREFQPQLAARSTQDLGLWFMGPKNQRNILRVSCKIKWFQLNYQIVSNYPHFHRILGGSLFWDTPAFHMLSNWCVIPIVLPNFKGPAFPVQQLQIVQACSWPLICWCCDILINSSPPTRANCNPSPPWHRLRSNHL